MYKVLTASKKETLETLINNYRKDGYDFVGGICVTYAEGITMYAQAMAKDDLPFIFDEVVEKYAYTID